MDGGPHGNIKGGPGEAEEGDALHRCLCREVMTGSSLLSKVRGDLMEVDKLCRGELKATNKVRFLLSRHVAVGSL